MTIETLITILSIDNLISWQSLLRCYLTIKSDSGQHSQFLTIKSDSGQHLQFLRCFWEYFQEQSKFTGKSLSPANVKRGEQRNVIHGSFHWSFRCLYWFCLKNVMWLTWGPNWRFSCLDNGDIEPVKVSNGCLRQYKINGIRLFFSDKDMDGEEKEGPKKYTTG